MDYIDKIRHARVVNYFNFNGPYLENEMQNTDLTIAKTIHSFINKYQDEIRQKYTIIIKFDNNALSYLTYCLVKNIISVIGKDLDVRYLSNGVPKEKDLFKGIKPIGLKKALRLKKAILITSYHPICNVISDIYFSNKFIEIYHPLENFTPSNLKILQDYYLKEDNIYYEKDLGEWDDEQRYWTEYFSYLPNSNREESVWFNKIHLKAFNRNNNVIVLFKLSGTEEDFDLYDFILKSSQEGNIHFYNVPADKIDFVKINLSPYLDCRNRIRDGNLISDSEFEFLSEQKEIYSYNYKEGGTIENTDSNC